jgi:hypothetical protein
MTTTKSVKCLLGWNIVVGGGFWIVYAIGLAIYGVSTGALNGQDGAYCLGYFIGCGLTLTLAAAGCWRTSTRGTNPTGCAGKLPVKYRRP